MKLFLIGFFNCTKLNILIIISILNVIKKEIKMKVTVKRLKEIFIECKECEDKLNEVCYLIQKEIHQDCGGIASIYFSDDEYVESLNNSFKNNSFEEFKQIAKGYIEFEKMFKE